MTMYTGIGYSRCDCRSFRAFTNRSRCDWKHHGAYTDIIRDDGSRLRIHGDIATTQHGIGIVPTIFLECKLDWLLRACMIIMIVVFSFSLHFYGVTMIYIWILPHLSFDVTCGWPLIFANPHGSCNRVCKVYCGSHTATQSAYKRGIMEGSIIWQNNLMIDIWKDILVNTKHLYNICTMLDQCRRRWADVVQMLYKCFVFAG